MTTRDDTIKDDTIKDEVVPWLKTTIGFLILLLVGSILLIVVLTLIYQPNGATLAIEVIKSLLQVITVLIFGTVVSLLVAQYQRVQQARDKENERHRQKLETIAEFQKDIIKRLARSYSSTKKARRLLRAKGLNPPYDGSVQDRTMYRDVYDEQMRLINEVELDLEMLALDIEASRSTFRSPDDLRSKVSVMSKYLNRLVDQYERGLEKFDKETSTLALTRLDPHGDGITDFLTPAGATDLYHPLFIDNYRAALELIRRDILQV